MNRIHLLVAVCLALPLAVEVPTASRDSSATRISVAGGVGTYALITRGCEGQVLSADQATFSDASAAIEHHFANPIGLGVREGTMLVRAAGSSISRSYVNPHALVDWKYVGFGGGFLHAPQGLPVGSNGTLDEWGRNLPSAHIRIGDRDVGYLLVSMLESQPMLSGGGYFDLGLGFRPRPTIRGFIGLSVSPYDGPGATLRSEIRVAPALFLDVNARLGGSNGVGENAIAVGLTLQRLGRGPRGASGTTTPAPLK